MFLIQNSTYREPSARQSTLDIQNVLHKALAAPGQPADHWLALLSEGARNRLAAEGLELLVAWHSQEEPGV